MMFKKVVLGGLLALGTAFNAQAQQARFGLTGGYLNVRASIKADGLTLSNSESGFYVGILADFELSEKFNLQPEFVYASIKEGEALMLPILGKFAMSERFNLLLGPQFVFSLGENVEDLSNVEIGLTGGLGFDIDRDFFVEARYSFPLNNSYTGDLDVKLRGNYLAVGLGYKFL